MMPSAVKYDCEAAHLLVQLIENKQPLSPRTVMWAQHGQAPHPPIRWRPYLCLTTVSVTFFCRVGRILAADRYRPVQQVHRCLGGEGGSFHSFRPWERTEVSHLYLLLRLSWWWRVCIWVTMLTGRYWTWLLKSVASPVLAYTYLPSITPLHHSSSPSEDGDEGTEPCEGLYLTVGLVFQTGSAGFTLKA